MCRKYCLGINVQIFDNHFRIIINHANLSFRKNMFESIAIRTTSCVYINKSILIAYWICKFSIKGNTIIFDTGSKTVISLLRPLL